MMNATDEGEMRIDRTSTGMTGDAAIAMRSAARLSAMASLKGSLPRLGGLLLLIGP